jgi:hypothetical protein
VPPTALPFNAMPESDACGFNVDCY